MAERVGFEPTDGTLEIKMLLENCGLVVPSIPLASPFVPVDSASSSVVREIARWLERRSRWPALQCGSFRLPHLPPGSEFRRTDSIGGEIAFMQAYEFGFGQLGETPAAGGIDFFL